MKVAIFDGNEPVTNIEKVTFDSTSENMDERTKQVVLVLEDRTYNKNTKYRLVLRDADTDIDQSSVDVTLLTGPFPMTSDTDTSLDDLLNQHFAGRVVRKDLTKMVKGGGERPGLRAGISPRIGTALPTMRR